MSADRFLALFERQLRAVPAAHPRPIAGNPRLAPHRRTAAAAVRPAPIPPRHRPAAPAAEPHRRAAPPRYTFGHLAAVDYGAAVAAADLLDDPRLASPTRRIQSLWGDAFARAGLVGSRATIPPKTGTERMWAEAFARVTKEPR